MAHLSLETLARLVDEPADPEEAAHLAACAECHAELEALREQTADLANLPDLEPPPDIWPALEARLRDEGLLRGARRRAGPSWMHLAASLAIFLLGGVVGFVLRGSSAAGEMERVASADARDAMTVEEAAEILRQTESAYLAALERYAELAGPATAQDPLTRLATLESIVLTTRAALDQAPADPVINGYHLSALAQRESTLRQIVFDPAEPWY
ncbi:MAG TPA: hypothetical protein VIL18_08855 [Longimicrobiales bacterium]